MNLPLNRLHQGDCVDLLQKLDAGTVDLVFADPPFNIGYEYDVYEDEQQADDYLAWCRQWISGVHRALKPEGTFWLAIGDEYAAELKIEAQKAGFHCRSWVIWYYTFGVNCVNGFSRSHTHLFHFVKDKKKFTFNRFNPQIRVQSARQLVYADKRANPSGRLPDNTWITRPQDAPLSFSPNHDTWYFARVAGTFKEREGFHGCQMPEQLLGRIILSSSNPMDLVLDPFGGSGTTLCVAKKLGRRFLGFELSPDYAKYINERLERMEIGELLDGPEDPIESAPATAQGKRRSKPFDADTVKAVIESFQVAGGDYPAEAVLYDPEIGSAFFRECKNRGIGGSATVWNRFLLELRHQKKLPATKKKLKPLTADELDSFMPACELAWRLLAIDYQRPLENILSDPDLAAEFDRLAAAFCSVEGSPVEFRRTALAIREQAAIAREAGKEILNQWSLQPAKWQRILLNQHRPVAVSNVGGQTELPWVAEPDNDELAELNVPGVFILVSGSIAFYVGESESIQTAVERILVNEQWARLEPTELRFFQHDGGKEHRVAMKAAFIQQEKPFLNCPLYSSDCEL